MQHRPVPRRASFAQSAALLVLAFPVCLSWAMNSFAQNTDPSNRATGTASGTAAAGTTAAGTAAGTAVAEGAATGAGGPATAIVAGKSLEAEVLIRGLDQPLGIAWERQTNALLIAESGKGRIAQWHAGKLETLYDGFPVAALAADSPWRAGPVGIAVMQPVLPTAAPNGSASSASPAPANATTPAVSPAPAAAQPSTLGERLLNRPAGKLAQKAIAKIDERLASGDTLEPAFVVLSRSAGGGGSFGLSVLPPNTDRPRASFQQLVPLSIDPKSARAAALAAAAAAANAGLPAEPATGTAPAASRPSRSLSLGGLAWNQQNIVYVFADSIGNVCLGRQIPALENELEPARLAVLRPANPQAANVATGQGGGAAFGLFVIATSPRGEVLVGDPGTATSAVDSRLQFFNINSGRRLLDQECGLRDIGGLAYSPLTGQLYALDLSLSVPGEAGLFQLVSEQRVGRTALAARRLATLERPTALAFADDGSLFVTVAPAAKASEPTGMVLRFGPGL